MAYRDLRQYIDALEQRGLLARVREPVAAEYEVGAICRKVLDHRGPALLFENVKGHEYSLATLLFGTRERFAVAMETSVEQSHQRWLERTGIPLKPVVVDTGPCKENILIGDAVDLTRFPIPVWNEMDGGPYLTLTAFISRDELTGSYNMGIYRAQVFDRNTIGVHAAPYRHLHQHWCRAGSPDSFPVAVALGLDPVLHIASGACFPFGVDELEMAGALRGEPVELVRCETIPLMVPATAEIILEGEYLPGEQREEGLFGEATGYYGIKVQRPVIRIKAITHRHNPILLGACVGRQPEEASVLRTVSAESEIMRAVSLPGIKGVHMTEGGCGVYNAVVAINKPFEGYSKMMGMAVLGTWAGRYIKNLIIVDSDIDPFNLTQVEWALATRFQPHRDIEVINDLAGHGLDPSIDRGEKARGTGLTSKIIIDATRKNALAFETPVRPHREIMQQVENEWDRYGIPL